MGTQTTVPCAQAESCGLLDSFQSLVSWYPDIVLFLPISIEPGVEKYLGLSVGDRVLCLQMLTAGFCKSVCCFVSCQSYKSRHPLEG